MKYKMTIYPAFEVSDFNKSFMFETAKEMVAAKNTAADLLLFMQDQAKVMEAYSNSFILEEKVDGEWEEYVKPRELELS